MCVALKEEQAPRPACASHPHKTTGVKAILSSRRRLRALIFVLTGITPAIFEAVGLTLRTIPKGERASLAQAVPMGRVGRRGRRGDHYKAEEHRGYAHEQESGVSRV